MKTGGLEQYSLCLGFRRNRGKISEIVVFASVGDGFQVFGISPVGDAYACNLVLLCHRNGFRLGKKGFIRQLVAGDPAAFLHKSDDVLGVGTGLRDLIQCIVVETVLFRFHRSFSRSFCRTTENMHERVR